MAYKHLALALTALLAAAPAGATDNPPATAPEGTPDTRYCMYIEAILGSRLEEVKCWTRAEWAERGVDVDKDWPKEGVRIQG